jgi:hypothetical protein
MPVFLIQCNADAMAGRVPRILRNDSFAFAIAPIQVTAFLI